jgi:hypothetical protein
VSAGKHRGTGAGTLLLDRTRRRAAVLLVQGGESLRESLGLTNDVEARVDSYPDEVIPATVPVKSGVDRPAL